MKEKPNSGSQIYIKPDSDGPFQEVEITTSFKVMNDPSDLEFNEHVGLSEKGGDIILPDIKKEEFNPGELRIKTEPEEVEPEPFFGPLSGDNMTYFPTIVELMDSDCSATNIEQGLGAIKVEMVFEDHGTTHPQNSLEMQPAPSLMRDKIETYPSASQASDPKMAFSVEGSVTHDHRCQNHSVLFDRIQGPDISFEISEKCDRVLLPTDRLLDKPNMCPKELSSRSKQIEHENGHYCEMSLEQVESEEMFVSHEQLKDHQDAHVGDNNYSCSQCGEKFDKEIELMQHFQLHTSEEPLLYNCTHCGNAFRYRSQFRQHILSHLEEKPHICIHCGKAFTRKSNLNTHVLLHTQKKPHKCGYCRESFTNKPNLDRHILSHSGEKPYKCRLCEKGFVSKYNLNIHFLLHSGGSPPECGHCGKLFSEYRTLSKHMLSHTKEKLHKCSDCGMTFRQMYNLNRHRLTHSGEKPHLCHQCGKAFNDKSTLSKHILTHSGEKPMYKCSQCEKTYTEKASLHKHSFSHTGEKHHKCSHCKKTFSLKNSLTQHVLLHSGVKPHDCSHCGKAFRVKADLRRHLLMHLGVKPHDCSHCGKAFRSKPELKKHLFIHSGVKPYECAHCGERFTQKSNLNQHMLKHSEKNLPNAIETFSGQMSDSCSLKENCANQSL